jgi:cytochrome P450
MHRDERFFPQPYRFRPERWTNAFERKLPRYAYFPFGGGPRVCIGRELALIESTLILSLLAPQFAVTLHDPAEVVPWPTVTLRVRDAVRAKVTARQSNGQPQPAVRSAVSCPHQGPVPQ